MVSAPGKMTDDLMALARHVTAQPDARELDRLLATGEHVGISLFTMAVRALGIPAVSLTGRQAGVEVQGLHTRGQIVRIRPKRILKEFAQGRIVTVAGFQGINAEGDITTLGRGGSDLTAVALAWALKTKRCEIFSDVKGVYTADPRIVSQARKLSRISCEEMLELAGAGAQVMQARSIEVAERFGVSIHVRSAFHPQPGTWIVPKEKRMLEKAFVSSLALDKSEVRLSVVDVPDRPGVAAQVISVMASENIPVDMILQSAPTHSGVNDISFMTPRAYANKAKEALSKTARALRARVDVNHSVAKVTAVGTGFRSHPWVAATMFQTLSKQKINIHMIVASDLRISCVIDSKHGETAVRALHRAYGLGRKK